MASCSCWVELRSLVCGLPAAGASLLSSRDECLCRCRYQPADRVTDADRANDRRSLKRRLDQRLFMLVRQKGGGGGWTLMQQGARAAGGRRRRPARRAPQREGRPPAHPATRSVVGAAARPHATAPHSLANTLHAPHACPAENAEGETMRQTAERALAEAVETSAVQPYFVGNAPAGHAALGDAGTLFFHR